MRFSSSRTVFLVFTATAVIPLWVQAAVLSEGDPLIPPGLGVGESFHLAFVTDSVGQAKSADIGFYNDFVQTDANTSTILGVPELTWKVMGSTLSVDARDNALVGGGLGTDNSPVYRLDNVKLANGYDSMWDGDLAATLSTNQNGQSPTPGSGIGSWTFTGSKATGVVDADAPLGELPFDTRIGYFDQLSDIWIEGHSPGFGNMLHFYALSEQLFIESATVVTGRSWRNDGSGDWHEYANWSPFGIPGTGENLADQVINFGDVITSPQTVFTNETVNAQTLNFENQNNFALGGHGLMNLVAGTDLTDPSINVDGGSHKLQLGVSLLADTTVTVTSGDLNFDNQVDLMGNTLSFSGEGNMLLNHSVVDTVGGGAVSGSGMLGTEGNTTIAANLTLDGATVDLDLRDSTGGVTSDRFDVQGSATLSGEITLNLDLAENFSPDSDITILTTTGGITDNSTSVALTGSGKWWFTGVDVVGNNLVLRAGEVDPTSGDYNNDGVVNAADYTLWADSLGTDNPLLNDPIGGTIGAGQYTQWKNNFGNTSSGSATAVPEPTGLVLLGLSVVVPCLWSRRRMMRFSSSLPVALVLIATAIIPLSAQAATLYPGDPLIPPGVSEGESFHFAFVTASLSQASSADIEYYNNLVQTEANTSTIAGIPDLTWKAIGSTEAVHARDNALVGGGSGTDSSAVYRLDNVKLANGFDSMWDGDLNAALNKDQNGAQYTGWSWTFTGSTVTGFVDLNAPLGTEPDTFHSTTVGYADQRTGIWISDLANSPGADNSCHFYALSEQIFVGEPTEITERSWQNNGSGAWNQTTNWTPLGAPGTGSNVDDQVVNFGSVIDAPQTVFTNEPVTVQTLNFASPNSYALAGHGPVNLAAGTDLTAPSINVDEGSHKLQLGVGLLADAAVTVSGGDLSFDGPVDLMGKTLSLSGSVILNHSVVDSVGGGSVTLLSGDVSGVGTISGDVDNQSATVSPGNSPGELTIDGHYNQGSGGTLAIEIGGTQAGVNHDVLNVLGDASLAGTLHVTLLDGFTPSGGDAFKVLTASGELTDAGLTLGGSDAGLFSMNIDTANDWIMLTTAGAGLAGDYNGNGTVDAADYTIFRDNLGGDSAVLGGNGSGAATVVVADYDLWKQNFGPSGTGSTAAVPEPTGLILLGLVVGSCLCGRRRWK